MRIVFLFALLIFMSNQITKAHDISALKPMMLETPLVSDGKPSAVIVAGKHYESEAKDLAEKLEAAIGVRLPVFNDKEGLRQLGHIGHVIALGQFANNCLIEKLYNRCYVEVDGANPGAGGYLLQSIHNPDGLGVNVVVVGGSDNAGVKTAAQRLIEIVQEGGSTLKPLFDVQPGWGKQWVYERCEQVLDPNRVWPSTHPMEVQQAIAEAGRLYLYTGDERLAEAYKREMFRFLSNTQLEGISDDFDYIMATWDRIEESPVFTDDDRLRITRGLWDISKLIRTDTELNYLAWKRVLNESQPRRNHRARYAGSLYFAGRYFLNYYRLSECRDWLAEVKRYWHPQMRATGVGEGLHPLSIITLNKALEYALAEDVESFLSPKVLGELADREMARTLGNTWLPDPENFQPFLFWTVAAHYLNDPRYLRPLARLSDPMRHLRMPWRHTWVVGGSHWTGVMPELDSEPSAEWINPVAVDKAYYNNTQTYGSKNVPHAKTFELLTIQDPLLTGEQYLSLLGISLGYVGTDGANAIEFFYLNGNRWLTGGARGGRVATAPKQSTLVVVRDGVLHATPTYAKLLGIHTSLDWGIARTQLVDHNGIDWTRNILNVPNKFFLVIDEATARVSDTFTLECRWVGYDHFAFDGHDAVFPSRKQTLRLSGIGWKHQYVRPWLFADYLNSEPQIFPKQAPFAPTESPPYSVQLAQRWAGQLSHGQSHQFVNLFSTEANHAQQPSYTLFSLGHDCYRIDGNNGECWIVARHEQTGWTLEPTEPQDVSDTALSGTIESADSPTAPRLRPDWTLQIDKKILSATAVHSQKSEACWAVGLADGGLLVLDAQGKQLIEHQIEGAVHALTAADLNHDGEDEIIAGTDQGNVAAFSTDGKPYKAWRTPAWTPGPSYRQSFGTWRNAITELRPFKYDKKQMLLVAGVFYYVLDESLRPVSGYEIPRELEITDLPGNGFKTGQWRINERTFVMTPVDFNGDGRPEVAGEEPHGYWLRVWHAMTGERLNTFSRPNDRYHGTSIKSIAAGDLDGDGKEEAIVGLDAFNQQLLVYSFPYQSHYRWARRVSGAVEAVTTANLTPSKGKEILVATELAQMQAFDADRNRLFVVDTHEPVGSTTALASWMHNDKTIIGLVTVNGWIGLYNAQGDLTAEGHIDGYGTHVIASDSGNAMLVVSTDGAIQQYQP